MTTTTDKPTLGRIVHYRGKHGFQATRAAIVTATTETLDPRGVEAGLVPALADDQHVHLRVFTPGESGGFTEYDVPPATDPANPEPGTWWWPVLQPKKQCRCITRGNH